MNTKVLFASLIIIIHKVTVKASADISCKDENGNFVDWFYAYKLPASYPHARPQDRGLSFIYMTPHSKEPTFWSLSSKNIDDSSSMIGRTVLQSFVDEQSSERVIVAYNDEPPSEKPKSSDGHTKGIVVADNETGFWLIHSVPLYPKYNGSYSYPSTGRNYGQSFLCISVNTSQVDVIGTQLIYNEPDIYLNVTGNFLNIYPNLIQAVKGKRITQPPYWNEATILSSAGVEFKSFAKNRHFQKELYEDWVSQVLNTNLYVETWRHGTGIIPSECPTSKRSVWNVSSIKIESLQFAFNSTDDHSKWAVSSEYSWICVGDINRAEHQKVRGGGTVCQQSVISTGYANFIGSFEPCPTVEIKFDAV